MFQYVKFQYMRDRCGAKRSLPLAADPSDGALGEAGLRPHPAPPPYHEAASVPARQTNVSEH